jgi:ATP-dependent Clp protease, protease subunit
MARTQVENRIMQSRINAIENDNLPIINVTEFDMEVAQSFIRRLSQYDSDPEVSDVYVYISSYGGEVFAGLAMIEAMNACSKPVHTVGIGLCASAGADLLICGTGRRWITENSFVHIHHSRGGMSGDVPGMDKALKQMKQVEDKIFKMIMSKSKISQSDMKSKLKEEQREWQMTAATAIKYGFVDVIGIPRFKKYTVVENDTE